MPFAHGNSSLCGYPGLVINESKMRKRKPLKAFVSLAFEVFSLSETFISYLRLFTPLWLLQVNSFSFPSTDTWRYSAALIVTVMFLESIEDMSLDTGGPCGL